MGYMTKRNYMKYLLTGCGFLISGLDEVLTQEGQEWDGMLEGGQSHFPRGVEDESRDPVGSSSTSVEILSNLTTLGQALILR
jgi:hypothetical protein